MRRSIKTLTLQLLALTAPTLLAAEGAAAQSAKEEVMVVTGTRSQHASWDSPIPTDSIAIEDARKRGKQNLADVLAEQPGVEVVPAIRGQTIRLQGFDSKYVLILIDGQRVTGKVGETFDLESISVEQIERVEIVRGAVSSLYGSDGIGGVVNVILRRPRTNSQDLRLRWGTDEETAIGGQASFVGETSDNTISVNASQLEPWRRTSSPATHFSGTTGGEITWQNNWNVRPDFSLKTRLGYQTNRIEGTDVSAAGAIWDRENETTRSVLQLSPEKHFEDGSTLKLDAQVQVHDDIYHTVARLQTSEQTREATREQLQEYTLSYQHELGTDHLITWGLTHIDEYLESDRLQSEHVDRQRHSLFAQDEWALGTDLTLVPGFRLDDDSQFGDHSSGKLALRYALSEDTVLRPSYGEGYRAPAFKELYLRFENLSVGYDVIGYADLQPETSKSYQFAIDHRLNAEQTLSLNLFQNDIRNLITATEMEQEGEGILHYTYRNVAKARTRGADLSWRWTGTLLETLLSYQYLEARDRTLNQVLEGRSRDTVAFQISRLKVGEHLSLHLSARWMGPQYFYGTETPQKTESATIASAGALYDWNKNWSSGVSIENLANSWEDRILQVRPRSYILTLNWNHQNAGKD
ncbi:TonB-dependent receptor plug domain-containing protein [Oligoflexus tunisiensis]|uniref:TonB-dependent receptor plug domain-containing protein n=1 Tax=Oligoflexus tunisiensis TaxID=708132 RepID=UPI00159F1218|nr:TonB-dependent receptor [Oligoflexus tunisiensis]